MAWFVLLVSRKKEYFQYINFNTRILLFAFTEFKSMSQVHKKEKAGIQISQG